MNGISVLIGGKAGFGIDKISLAIASFFSKIGYKAYVYRDYPSLIRGGHTFSIIRASVDKVAARREGIDVLIALNQDTFDFHKDKLADDGILIYDSGFMKQDGIPAIKNGIDIPVGNILKEEGVSEIMRNTCMAGALSKAVGIGQEVLGAVLNKAFTEDTDQNIRVGHRGYESSREIYKLNPDINSEENLPLLTGNQAIALGLVKAGLDSYISYPMTPTSPILHYLAMISEDAGIKVIHPENEIAVVMMAAGMVYAGEKAAVGTSGGGFCLMTEGLSFSGMAELPVVFILGQRPGPSTGLPTYTCQTELQFVLSAGQGEFVRFIIAPSDSEEAYFASQMAMDISWKYQIPSIILTDKEMGESAYSFNINDCEIARQDGISLWNRTGSYGRYIDTDNGVSPLAFPSDKEAIVKVSSYEHDEFGITTEDPVLTKKMQDKRLRKEKYLAMDLESRECVKVFGNEDSDIAIITWGSNRGVCQEVAEILGVRGIQPLILSPFPVKQFVESLDGVKKNIVVECNATGQLVKIMNQYGITTYESILKYDGRPFSVEELTQKIEKVIG